jgi:hypothetical protein
MKTISKMISVIGSTFVLFKSADFASIALETIAFVDAPGTSPLWL